MLVTDIYYKSLNILIDYQYVLKLIKNYQEHVISKTHTNCIENKTTNLPISEMLYGHWMNNLETGMVNK